MKVLKKGTNPQGNDWIQFHAILKSSVSKETETDPTKLLKNSNGKPFKICTVEFENVKGEKILSSCGIYEGNYKYGVEEGKSYLTTATNVGGVVYLQMSHLSGAPRADFSDFDGLFETTKASEFAPGVAAK